MTEAAARQLTVGQLDRVLDEPGALDVHFQPVTGFDTREICGVEALLRVTLDGTPIPPPAVIAAAVANERMRAIGRQVLERACEAHHVLSRAGGVVPTMMVNLDVSELRDEALVDATAETLARFDVDPGLLVLELTETALIDDLPVVRANLAALRALGVGLALDDFGAGYASLSYLRSVPLTMVKLDRQFALTVDTNGTDHEIARNVIRLGHALGLRVVAEGIEADAQRLAFEALGCDAWQGFLRSPAVPLDDIILMLRDEARASTLTPICPAASDPDELDSFVLRRVGSDRFAHLGGAGRGAGWAGIVEIEAHVTPVIAEAVEHGVVCVEHVEQQWLAGPYHPRCAAVVSVDHDTIVIFGSTTHSNLPELSHGEWSHLAAELAAETTSVSPAKRLADELEMSEAMQSLITNTPQTLDEAMRHVVASVAGSLSCEFAVLYLAHERLVVFDDHMIHNADHDAVVAALDELAARATEPICVQDADARPIPVPLPNDYGVRSWIALPTAPSYGGLLICAHTDRNPRGFTTMCQNLGRKLADASELVLHAGAERERLAAEADLASAEARCDALTGVLNRRGWDDAVAACMSADQSPVSVVVADLNNLKLVNDSEGHAVGDELLVAAARCLTTLVRSVDVVARIGGDEFAILMRGADERVCTRFRAELDTLIRAEQIHRPRLSIAVGFATNHGGRRLADTVCLADARMYEAKARSKTRLTSALG